MAKYMDALLALESWISKNGWAGYDPYDIRGQDWFARYFGYQTRFYKKVRGALAVIEQNLPPNALRRILRIKKEINAKAMGLMASGYLSLFKTTGQQQYLVKAEDILAWLASNGNQAYPGISWGYPFHWQSGIFTPRGTPSSVVTGVVGDAWLDHYELSESQESQIIARRVAEFFLNGLNRYKKRGDQICFSYTPLDNFKVHNANLFAAAFLARLWAITSDECYKDLSLKAVRYTLSEQNDDGSFYYWGSDPRTMIDHYHTGFILRHLDTIQRATGADFINQPLKQGYSFYVNELFTGDGVPKYTPDSLYPINIHSCSEAILCLSQLGTDQGGFDRLEAVVSFTIKNMRADEGFYIAELRKRWWGEQKVTVPYMRWAQAWMFLALARLQENLKCNEKMNHSRG
jgi:hypothetical protein